MRRMIMVVAALASLAFAAPSPSQAATSVGFSLRIGDPYRGASVRFRSGPDWVVVPRTQVYYIRDYYGRDMYRYGGWIYLVDDGYWYRARSYRGPFIMVDFRRVPSQIRYVPTSYRRWDSRGYYGFTRDRYYYRHGGNWGNDRYDRDYRDNDRYDRNRRYRTRDRNWEWEQRDGDRNRTRTRTRDRDGNRDRDNRDRDGNWDRDGNRDRDGDQDRDGDRDRDWNGDRN